MQTEVETAAETVEWGSEAPRPRWFDRFGGLPSGRQTRAAATAAIVAAVLGFGLVLAAEVLPWMHFGATEATEAANPDGVGLAQLSTLLVIGYHLSLAGVLALTAATVAGRPANRRFVAALGLGWAAGHAVLLTGIYGSVQRGGEFGPQFPGADTLPTTVGVGLQSAAAGLVLLAAAVTLAGWWASRPDHPHGAGPHHPHASRPDHPHGAGPHHPHASRPDHPHGAGPHHPHASRPDHPHGDHLHQPHGAGPDQPHGDGPGLPHPRHDPARHDPARHDSTRHDPARHDSTRHDPARHDPARHDPARHDRASNNRARHDSAGNGDEPLDLTVTEG